jgi:hypothetical protein
MSVMQLDVPRDQWAVGELRAVRNVLEHVGGVPELARQWRGRVWLTFDQVDKPDAMLVPEIQAFVRALYDEFPHLLYFFDPEPRVRSLGFYLVAMGLTETSVLADALPFVESALRAAAVFAIGRGDDWIAATTDYVDQIDRAMLRRLREFLIAEGHMHR